MPQALCFATHARQSTSVASKGFRLHQSCADIALISRGGHRRGQKLAAIVPRSYYTRGIRASQEESIMEDRVAAAAIEF